MSNNMEQAPMIINNGVVRLRGLKKKFTLPEVVEEYNALFEQYEFMREDFNTLGKENKNLSDLISALTKTLKQMAMKLIKSEKDLENIKDKVTYLKEVEKLYNKTLAKEEKDRDARLKEMGKKIEFKKKSESSCACNPAKPVCKCVQTTRKPVSKKSKSK